jgi:3D (Asp-Asp-Asp) domain-containing protein
MGMGRLGANIVARYYAAIAILLPAGIVAAQPGAAIDDFALPGPPALAHPKNLYATAYIVQGADESADPADPALVGPDGQSLGLRIPRHQWCLAADEGSLAVNLINGSHQAYVYAGRGSARIADCSDVFTKMKPQLRAALDRSTFRPAPADAPYGVGSIAGYRLVPFRSIAIDRGAGAPLKLGQVVYIPKLRGASITLIDGRTVVHDGYVMTVDTGGAIKGRHVDFFEGPRKTDALIRELASPFDAYVVDDPAIIASLTRLHRR